MADEQLRIILKGDGSDLEKSLKKASGQLKAFGSKVKSIGSSLTKLSIPLGIAGGAAIKMAASYQESLNKVEVSFKDTNKQVKDFAKTTLDSFGIAESTALDMAATFGDMSTSMGLSTKEAADMSTSLVGLAGDLSSFKDIGVDQINTALSGIFTGETESLKRLGIVMTEANLAQFALSQGIQKNIKDFTQAEKVQLRYQYVMSKTINAQGDFERTQGSAANQMRYFQQSMKELAVTFGETILPMFTEMIKKVNALLKEFKALSPETKKNIMIFGGIVAALGPALTIIGNVTIALGKMKTAITALGTASSGAVGIAIGAIGGLLFAFDQLTDKIANNLSLWEKLKITFESGGLFSPTGMAQAVAQMGAASFNKGEQDKQDSQLSGMALLGFGQEKTKSDASQTANTFLTELETDLANFELDEAILAAESIFSNTDLAFQLAASEANIESFASRVGYIIEGIGEQWGDIGETLSNNFAQVGASIAGSLADAAFSGSNFIDTLSQALIGLIKKLVVAAATAAILAAFTGGGSAAAGASGAAGVGKALTGLAKSTTAFANGGIVSTPTLGLVGEYAGARSNPEVIAPLDKLKSLIGDRPGGNVHVTGQFGIDGQDLKLVLDRASKEQNRIG